MIKRILFINYDYPPFVGGSGNAMYYLLQEFKKKKDIEITGVVANFNNKFETKKIGQNITIYKLPIGDKRKNLHYQRILDLIRYAFALFFFLRKHLKSNKYDNNFTYFTFPCGFISFLFRKKVHYNLFLRGSDVPFYNERFYWLDKIFFQYLSKLIWKYAENVIANSEDLKKLALKIAPNQNIKIIYNGVDTDKFYPIEKKNKSELVILSTQRLIQRKGIQYLIEAFIEFYKKYQNSKLVIVGTGNLERELKQIANDAGGLHIIFLGNIDHNELQKIYHNADIFVLPSLNEGMSNSLLEAAASGLAIISTDTGGAKMFFNQYAAIQIQKKDSKDILNALENLYFNRGLLMEMQINSRKLAENLNWPMITKKYEKLIYN